ncbi:hypothetical protein D3C87_482720 [compost metagenome]
MSNFVAGPSTQDVSEMQKLINLMNGQAESTYEPIRESAPVTVPAVASGNPDAAAMKKILENFYGAAGEAISEVVRESTHDRRLQEAMQTHRTDEGAIIGSWEVRVKITESAKNGAKVKMYDVLHPGTKSILFSDLVIFEAAHAIVRYLNKGLPTTHNKIVEIADLEEIYRRNRQDAIIFKKRYERCLELKEQAAGEVFEARYQKARAQAIVANDSIKTILDNIR